MAITEQIILHGGEEAEIAVARPFEPCAFAVPPDKSDVETRLAPEPTNREAGTCQRRTIGISRDGNPLLAVVKYVDVA
jgi:hypothetical protein